MLPPVSYQQNNRNGSALQHRSNGAEVSGTVSSEPLHNTLKSSFQISGGPNALPPSQANNLRSPVSLPSLRESEIEIAEDTHAFEGNEDAQRQTDATQALATEQESIEQPNVQQTSFDRTIDRQHQPETNDLSASQLRAIGVEAPQHTLTHFDTPIQQSNSGIFPLFSFTLGFLFCLGLVATASFVILRKVALTNGSLFRIEMVESATAQSPHQVVEADHNHFEHGDDAESDEEPSQVDLPLDQPFTLESLGPTFDEKQKLLRKQEQEKETGMIEELYKHNLELRERLKEDDA